MSINSPKVEVAVIEEWQGINAFERWISVATYMLQGFVAARLGFSYDAHGIYIEHGIDKKFDFFGKEAVGKFGLANYNHECRSIVMRYREEWRHTVEKLGPWIKIDDDYKIDSQIRLLLIRYVRSRVDIGQDNEFRFHGVQLVDL
ncbi:hypothetical protein F4679DRAFT_586569 [Xylaria curta]|nr:hypothetical protein F4679DRAFT_586569 [Xylaria curta]